MSFEDEFEETIADHTLEELKETKIALEQAYAAVNRKILERSAAPSISEPPPRWKYHRN